MLTLFIPRLRAVAGGTLGLRLRCSLACPLAAAAALLPAAGSAAAPAEGVGEGGRKAPLNVLIIQTDEHNFRTLGCYRKLMAPAQAFIWGEGVEVETPHIDWIAETGAICDRFYATSPVCTPSRASLVSGRYPQNTGAITNNLPLRDDVVTFAEILRRRGYATGYIGKWHLDGPAKPGWKPARNFGFSDNRYMFNRGHWKKLGEGPEGPRVAAVRNGKPTYALDGADETSFTTDFLTDRTIDFIRTHRGRPFCLMTAIPDPHGPNTVRPPYDTMFDPARFEQPASARGGGGELPAYASVLTARFNALQMALYFGMVKCIDDNVGRVLAELRRLDLIDRTLIVFTSDHGDMCGEHGRHNKGIPCEGSARIPFVIRAPGVIPPGTVLHPAMGTVDFKPTLLGLLGVDADGGAVPPDEGRDASALFRTGEAPPGWEDVTFVRNGGGDGRRNGWFGAFSGRYKLVLSPVAAPGLFDLQEDPNELENRFTAPEQRDEVRRLAMALKAYGERFKEPHMGSAAVQADLEWALSGEGVYAAPERPRRGPGGKRRPQR